MYNNLQIDVAYGETITKTITLISSEEQPLVPGDMILFVVRSACGHRILWRTGNVVPYPTNPTKCDFHIEIDHVVSETELTPGIYKWGLSVYRNAILDDSGIPREGLVAIPVPQAPFVVSKSISSEDGLE